MAYYGINDKVEIEIEGKTVSGRLVDIDIAKRRFKVKTKDGEYWWITQGQINNK